MSMMSRETKKQTAERTGLEPAAYEQQHQNQLLIDV